MTRCAASGACHRCAGEGLSLTALQVLSGLSVPFGSGLQDVTMLGSREALPVDSINTCHMHTSTTVLLPYVYTRCAVSHRDSPA
jgi:hypothetical protein